MFWAPPPNPNYSNSALYMARRRGMQHWKDFVNRSSSLIVRAGMRWKRPPPAWSIDSWATGYCDVDMHTISFVETGAAPGGQVSPSSRERHLLHSVAHPWDQACSILRGRFPPVAKRGLKRRLTTKFKPLSCCMNMFGVYMKPRCTSL